MAAAVQPKLVGAISRMDPRTVELPPFDLGPEVRPRDLVIGDEYYYIRNPDSERIQYHRRVYTGTRPNMRKTAYMKTKGSSGDGLYDWDLVPLGPAIFYKVLGPMTNAEKQATMNVLGSRGLFSETIRHITNYANVGYKRNNSAKRGSGGSSGGRRKMRRTRRHK